MQGQRRPPEEQNTFHLQRIKTANTRKTRGGNACRESHGAAVGEGAGAPAPTGAGSSASVPYRAWPWAWGRGLPPAPGTSPSTQKRKEKGQGAPEQTDSTVLTHLRASSPEATVQAAASLHRELVLPPGAAHSPEGAGTSQLRPRASSLPAARPARGTGERGRQTQALQRANTGDLHVSPKRESEPVAPLPRLLTLSRPLKMSHCRQQRDSRREKATAASPRHGTAPTNGTGSSVSQAGGQRAGRRKQNSALKSPPSTQGQAQGPESCMAVCRHPPPLRAECRGTAPAPKLAARAR